MMERKILTSHPEERCVVGHLEFRQETPSLDFARFLRKGVFGMKYPDTQMIPTPYYK